MKFPSTSTIGLERKFGAYRFINLWAVLDMGEPPIEGENSSLLPCLIMANKLCLFSYYLVDYSYDMGDRLSKAISIEENYRKMSVPERQGLLYDIFVLIRYVFMSD